MKYKNYLKNLKARQQAFDKMSGSDKNANTRPGSQKK